jgi:hypothetical protein
MTELHIQDALAHAVRELRRRKVRFALVGGLAVTVRGIARFTRDVDFAVLVAHDRELETLVFDLRGAGYRVSETIEQDARERMGTARLFSPSGWRVDTAVAPD